MRESVIPDGYVAFGLPDRIAAFAIEFDRGTEAFDDQKQSNWLKKITGLLALMSGDPPRYRQYFPYEALTIAVVVKSSESPRTKKSWDRLQELVHWTENIIRDAGYSELGGDFFRFTIADPRNMTPQEFVMGEHWIVPFTYQYESLLPVS